MWLLYITTYFIKFFNIGDVKYAASARLNEDDNLHVSGNTNKHEQAISTCCIVYPCVSPYKGMSWQSADDVLSK